MRSLLHRSRSTAVALLLALAAVLASAGSAGAAEAPTINKPADQAGVTGKAVTVTVTGTNLATVTAKGLPAGVAQPVEVAPNEWKIEGTPTTVETTTVTLEAENTEKVPATPVEFKWTVTEPEAAATITKPADKASVAGKPAAVTVKGEHLATLEAKGLPNGVTSLVKVSTSEWRIEGEPTTAETATVTLEAKNAEGAAGTPVEFKWTVTEPEPIPTIVKPSDQSSTSGTAIAPLVITGSHLASLLAKQLPAGLELTPVSETEWKITGTPTAALPATTVTLEATNKEGASTPVTFVWTVSAPAAPPPAEPKPTPTPTPTIPSAGRLGTVPVQKQGKELFATFLCEVTSCKVTITATIKAGKSTFKVRSNVITILQGKKPRIPLRIKKKQRELISAALKKHKKVTAALSASIDSSVGKQLTKALLVTVKR